MKARKTMTVLSLALAFAAAAPTAAQATAPAPTAAQATAPAVTEPTAAQAAKSAGTGIIATYKGTKIDLSKGWGAAQACAEVKIGDVRCYDSAADADRALGVTSKASGGFSTKALSDCPSNYICLWDNRNYWGRRLQWSASGTKKLGDWGFRDRTNSASVNRPQFGVECVDYKTGLPDPRLFLGAGSAYNDFGTYDHPYEANWNNKVDEIRM